MTSSPQTPDDAVSGGPTLIRSVVRASRLLIAIASAADGCTGRELAERFSLSTPTTHNLLRTLISEGLIERGTDHRYRLGASAVIIADGVSATLQAPEIYRDAVDRLAALTGEAAYLSGRSGGQVTLLRGVQSAHAVRVESIPVGYSANLHARASGKIMIAFAPAAEQDRMIRQLTFAALTRRTLRDAAALRAELERVRRDEVAYDREEFVDGAVGISVPIWASGAVVASLSLHVPTTRFSEREPELLAALQTVAASISHSGAQVR